VVGSIRGEEKNGEKIKNAVVIIVDDVYTTGATVRECVREVKKAGVKKIIVFCIARSR
jgi:competence protein ComFC